MSSTSAPSGEVLGLNRARSILAGMALESVTAANLAYVHQG